MHVGACAYVDRKARRVRQTRVNRATPSRHEWIHSHTHSPTPQADTGGPSLTLTRVRRDLDLHFVLAVEAAPKGPLQPGAGLLLNDLGEQCRVDEAIHVEALDGGNHFERLAVVGALKGAGPGERVAVGSRARIELRALGPWRVYVSGEEES